MSLNNTPLQGAHTNVVSGNFIIAYPLGVEDGDDYCLPPILIRRCRPIG